MTFGDLNYFYVNTKIPIRFRKYGFTSLVGLLFRSFRTKIGLTVQSHLYMLSDMEVKYYFHAKL